MLDIFRPLSFRPASLTALLAAVTCVLLLGGAAQASGPEAAPATGRVLVLGFDGADWRTTERMMDAGELPNLGRLREMGSAGPLVSTDPAESAAGWAAINTGANPVKNGVPSFIHRKVYDGSFVGAGLAHIRQEDGSSGVESGGSGGLVSSVFSALAGVPSPAVAAAAFLLGLLVFRLVLKAGVVLAVVLSAALGAGAYFAAEAPGAGAALDRIPGVVENEVKLDGFWIEAARGGAPSVALQAPMALGRPGAQGARTLFGLGVPDVRQSMNGDWFLYTTDTLAAGRPPRGKVAKGSGTGTTFRVDFETPEGGGDRVIETFVYGPLDYVALAEAQAEYDGIVDLQNDRERFQELGFQESQELNKRRKKLEKTLREMGEDPSGSGTGAKLHLHRTSAPLRVVEKAAGETYEVTLGATTQTLSAGAWSDFFPVRFELSPTVEVSAITRLRVVDTDPFELYVDTLQFDPKHPTPWQPTSEPASFSPQLVDLVGARFETLGWGCMTNQVKDKMVDPRYFLEDVEFTMTYRRKLMEKMLAEDDWRVLYSVFSATDRVQHMMYADHDEGHPLHDPERAASTVTFFGEQTRLADAIPAIYRQMDAIVGDALAALRDGDTLMLCADHGFTSYRRGMNVNNWLVEEGYQVLREGLSSTSAGGGLGAVDWSKTRAYALGLGMVYLNLEGREPEGIVAPADADALMAEICERFLAARDEGRVVGTSAIVVKDVYQGGEEWGSLEYPCSDVMLGFAEYYRASWTSVDGSIALTKTGDGAVVPGPTYEDNDKPWSGDHASNDRRLVSGIFFSSEKVAAEDGEFSVLDIAPTVLDRLGVPAPPHFDRAPLKVQ